MILTYTLLETHPTGTLNTGGIVNGNWEQLENIFADVADGAGIFRSRFIANVPDIAELITLPCPSVANDAAADADLTIPSGGLYRTTAGGRTVFRKP